MEMLRFPFTLPYEGIFIRRAVCKCSLSNKWRFTMKSPGRVQNLGFHAQVKSYSSWRTDSHSFITTTGTYCTKGATGAPGGDREILVQHLLVKEDQLDLVAELEKRLVEEDIDLSDLATEFSVCPSKTEGGMLGWVSKGRMVPEFEQAAFDAPLNKIVRVKTKFGWHLLQVLSERQAGFLVEIQPEELYKKMEDPEFRNKAQLIDVREPNEIKLASLEGFKPYPLSRFGEWGPTVTETLDPEKDTYVMCHHGVRSMQAAQWLKSQGFSRLHNVAGGIHAYSTRVDDKIPVY